MNIEEMDISEDSIIAFAQRERLRLLTELTDEPKLKIKLLDSLASTAVGVKRIKTEDANAASDRAVASALADAIRNVGGNPFMMTDPNHPVKVTFEPILPAITILPDENLIAQTNLSYQDINPD